jgi:hypothetical protein
MLFRNTFQENRKKISNFFKEGAEVKPWEFGNELVFTRLDKFVERLQIVEVKYCHIHLYTVHVHTVCNSS